MVTRPRVAIRSKLKEPPEAQERQSGYPGQLPLFLAAFCLYLFVSYLFAFHFRVAMGDALSRTYGAFAAMYSEYPRLTAIGFSWPPLLGLLQIPLVVFKPLTFYGFSGMIVSSAFGASTVVVMDWLYIHYGFGRLHRTALGLLFALNPFIVFYSASGMSEMLFLFFFTLAIAAYIRWHKANQWRFVALIAMAVAMAFYTRYEAAVLAAAMFIAILFSVPHTGEGAAARLEGTLLSYTTMVSYAILLWVFINWLIMGDPLFWYRSEYYSNFYQVREAAQWPEVIAAQQSILATIAYGVQKTSLLSPLFTILVVLVGGLSVVRRDKTAFWTVFMSLAIPIFYVYSFRQGMSYGWDRFYITAIPCAFILYGILITLVEEHGSRLRAAFVVVFLLAFVGATAVTFQNMRYLERRTEERTTLEAVLQRQVVDNHALDIEVASYIKERVKGRDVLVDTAYSFGVVLFSGAPELFVQNSDPDFGDVLAEPYGRVSYILHAEPGFQVFNIIDANYPTLWEKGAPFAVLEKDFGTYRLYRVIGPARPQVLRSA